MISVSADEFLKRGFGYLTKKDYEIILFHELIKLSDYSSKTDYELSVLFKTSPTKIANLRSDESAYFNAENIIANAKSNFFKIVKQSCVMHDNRTIMLLIKDRNTRNYIVSLMNDNMMLSDTSFNRNILKIDIEDYIVLLGMLDDKTKELSDLLQKLNERLTNEGTWNWKDLLIDIAGAVAEGAFGKIGGKLVDLSVDGIKKIIQQKTQKN